ncbi:hypothetical protein ABZ413_24655 [Nocardia rhamnosiphila]|uniref:hypothetical protein n=1 Tax=Nocardia rhamnosiphila TaxID=426716 RepID=UPI0033F1CABB
MPEADRGGASSMPNASVGRDPERSEYTSGIVEDVYAAIRDGRPPLRTGLGHRVDDMVVESGTLTELTFQILRRGWTIRYGDASRSGSYADSAAREIIVDRDHEADPDRAFVALAHEVGHANDPDLARALPYRQGETREEWVRRSVHNALREEGEATLVEIQCVRELNQRGYNISHGIPVDRLEFYEEIFDSYNRGYFTRDEAKDEIAAMFRGEVISGVLRNYETHHLETYSRIWDIDHGHSISTVEPSRDPYLDQYIKFDHG